MSSDRDFNQSRPPDYDVMCAVRNDAKTRTKPFWHKLGAAWSTTKGISVKLDVIPAGHWDGKFMLFPRDNQGRQETRKGGIPPPDDDGSPV